ncbi:MAG: PepSY domain-containing protein, partial [Pirellulales bacterium]
MSPSPMRVPWPDYRAVWRWHFYAGLACIPFVVVLALSGAVYLFKAELEAWQERRYDSLATGTAAPPSAQVAAVLAAFPRSRFEGYEIPAGPGRAARVLIDHPGDA